jgi:hypothetical protein
MQLSRITRREIPMNIAPDCIHCLRRGDPAKSICERSRSLFCLLEQPWRVYLFRPGGEGRRVPAPRERLDILEEARVGPQRCELGADARNARMTSAPSPTS